jgi:hypothetical protein
LTGYAEPQSQCREAGTEWLYADEVGCFWSKGKKEWTLVEASPDVGQDKHRRSTLIHIHCLAASHVPVHLLVLHDARMESPVAQWITGGSGQIPVSDAYKVQVRSTLRQEMTEEKKPTTMWVGVILQFFWFFFPKGQASASLYSPPTSGRPTTDFMQGFHSFDRSYLMSCSCMERTHSSSTTP